jgi:hypothetical protein
MVWSRRRARGTTLSAGGDVVAAHLIGAVLAAVEHEELGEGSRSGTSGRARSEPSSAGGRGGRDGAPSRPGRRRARASNPGGVGRLLGDVGGVVVLHLVVVPGDHPGATAWAAWSLASPCRRRRAPGSRRGRRARPRAGWEVARCRPGTRRCSRPGTPRGRARRRPRGRRRSSGRRCAAGTRRRRG